MANDVVITGMGLVSALADSPAALHQALLEGRRAHRQVELFDTGDMGSQRACEVRGFEPQAYLGKKNFRPLNRAAQFTCAAAQLALADGDCSEEMRAEQDVGLVMGTQFCSVHTITRFDHLAITRGPAYASPLDFANTVINAATGQTAIWHNLRGINSTLSTGPTSGLSALGYAADLVRNGRVQTVLAGGVEELCFESLFACSRAGLAGGPDGSPVPFAADRDGFSLGEGAAFLLLEDAETARQRGARVLGRVAAYGSAFDPARGVDAERTVATAERAIVQALATAGLEVDDISAVSAGANGSPKYDRIEAQALARIWGPRLAELPLTAVKGALGEALGVSGVFQAIALIESMRAGVLPGISGLQTMDAELGLRATEAQQSLKIEHGLLTGVGFDGVNCAVALSAPEGQA
jgi:3-oxoacyl-[acyl-carrier-protein] synthase II